MPGTLDYSSLFCLHVDTNCTELSVCSMEKEIIQILVSLGPSELFNCQLY